MPNHSSWLLYILSGTLIGGRCLGWVHRDTSIRTLATAHAAHRSTTWGRLEAHASRRHVLVGGFLFTSQLSWMSKATAAVEPTAPFFLPESATLEPGMLESRVLGNVLAPPPFGMEGPDIFYPEWFLGSWKVKSETMEIQAPCGIALFGGNATYSRALQDVGNILAYESRFILDDSGRVIADREFNVRSIAKVAMGENSVVNVAMATPNKFSCLLAPMGSPSILKVDLIVLNRRQETVASTKFDCSEVVREIASPLDQPKQVPAILKEIETTSLYTYFPDTDQIYCRQRSAAFLLPSNENPMAMKMWQASGGRAIDVRYYDVKYTRS